MNPFVLEISPFGSCSRRGHSFADGMYLKANKKNIDIEAVKNGNIFPATEYRHQFLEYGHTSTKGHISSDPYITWSINGSTFLSEWPFSCGQLCTIGFSLWITSCLGIALW